MTQKTRLRGGELLARALKEKGVDHVFTLLSTFQKHTIGVVDNMLAYASGCTQHTNIVISLHHKHQNDMARNSIASGDVAFEAGLGDHKGHPLMLV